MQPGGVSCPLRKGGGDEGARQDGPPDVEMQGAVHAPGRVGFEVALGGGPGGERGEVVRHALGAEALWGCEPGQAAMCSGLGRCLRRLSASSIRQRW